MWCTSTLIYRHSSLGLYWQETPAREESLVHDEGAFARRLKERDPEAWTKLYEEYMPRVYRYVVARVNCQAEAEDLTEQVFMKALESGPSYRWRGTPTGAWLFRIARNQVIDYWRTNKSSRNLPLDEGIVDGADGPERMAELSEDIRRLNDAMTLLTDAQREVIHLRFMGGLSTAEVAKVMGKSQGAVKVMQHSALASLRKKMCGWDGYEQAS